MKRFGCGSWPTAAIAVTTFTRLFKEIPNAIRVVGAEVSRLEVSCQHAAGKSTKFFACGFQTSAALCEVVRRLRLVEYNASDHSTGEGLSSPARLLKRPLSTG
jgi:hypothetical protein